MHGATIKKSFVFYNTNGTNRLQLNKGKGKGKAILFQAWTGPEGTRSWDSQISRQSAHECGKVVSLTHGPP